MAILESALVGFFAQLLVRLLEKSEKDGREVMLAKQYENSQGLSLQSLTSASKPAACQSSDRWSRGPMDRTMASEAVGSGSIPLGTTTHKNLKMRGVNSR